MGYRPGCLRQRIVAAVACSATLVLVSGCGGSGGDGTPAASPAPTTGTSTTLPSPAEDTEPPASPPGTVSAPYRAESLRVTGSTGRVDYDVVIPQISGGDPAVVAEFDQSMRAALQDQIDAPGTDRFSLSTQEYAVTRIGERVVAGLLVTSYNMDPPGAHPTPQLATVVVDTDTAAPVTLSDLFPDLQAGLQRLSEQSALLLPATAAGAEFDRNGIEPEEANFANWLPTPAGLEIHFADYQVGPHAIGLVTVTVPWEALSDVMDPAVAAVVQS